MSDSKDTRAKLFDTEVSLRKLPYGVARQIFLATQDAHKRFLAKQKPRALLLEFYEGDKPEDAMAIQIMDALAEAVRILAEFYRIEVPERDGVARADDQSMMGFLRRQVNESIEDPMLYPLQVLVGLGEGISLAVGGLLGEFVARPEPTPEAMPAKLPDPPKE